MEHVESSFRTQVTREYPDRDFKIAKITQRSLSRVLYSALAFRRKSYVRKFRPNT
ncbi:hypothetical protein PUN28_010174 [Cardiocondyla obscurior]|uniref:Uncharacterized protein n=1 Tax=Cardiocondyla obscurior TaxID=286306 RepID=A0AAW2FMW7_9HYME